MSRRLFSTGRRLIPALLLALVGAALAPVTAGAAGTGDGLVVHYPLRQSGGTVVTDASGHGRDATLAGDATWRGAEGLELGGTDGHVRLPGNLLRDLTEITVSVQARIDPAQASPYFIWGLGNSAGGAGNGYLFTTGNSYRTSIASGNWATEQTVTAGRDLTRDVWKTLTYTLADGTAVLYEDGAEVARESGITLTPASIGAGTTTENYLGRSLYRDDRYFMGGLRDFRIYDRALGAAEVRELGFLTDAERAERDAARLDLGDLSGVTTDLALPENGPYGSTITWRSSDESVVSGTGTVTRPAPGSGDAIVTLTATVTSGQSSVERAFTVTVLEEPTDAEKVADAAAALVVHDAGDVRGNLTLPTSGRHGTTVSWHSTKKRVVTPTGEVNRPRPGAGPVALRLTATVRLGNEKDKRRFDVTVRPLPEREPYAGYAFSYFTGEGYPDGEQIYFAASEGNDPLRWTELNGGEPVLTSTKGEGGVRDPFLIRSPEGDKFYLIATDLKIHGNGDWDGAQRHGSKYIEVWESTDLVHWSEQRHVRVAPDTAGNTWAPEAFYDESIGAYVVFWASKLYSPDDPGHTGNTYNRMLYATTRDFHTFSEPKVWVDPGYSVIDSTVLKEGGTYHRFTKDERAATPGAPCGKYIVQEKSDDLRGLDYELVAECIGKGDTTNPGISRGEGPTVFKSNTEDKWYLFIDEFGGRGYVPFETTDLESGRWTMSEDYDLPDRPRHGTVLPVTAAELRRLHDTW
ncbi:glycosyl hydrolase family 43 [Prauserella shujinwangii]|uniref:Glycosyl hydrolase family 43 n=1 Tax=Prauserella shujinwangii TaxID=1453103 RepID=A0A2T0LZ54_9PSEU|nr:immunoglobulin-like domain-containing protein [Prauserella shujinwangii]PRX49397.1 glycosyl hydrolase family 43 [Prauserella shujinwangii]